MCLPQEDIENILHKVFLGGCEEFLSDDDIASLVETEDTPSIKTTIVGYPSKPFYKELSKIFCLWMTNKACPLNDLPPFNLLDESTYLTERSTRLASVSQNLYPMLSLWDHWSNDEKFFRWRSILQTIGRRGLLDLLGLRKTNGTQDLWPPAKQYLLQAFEELHKPPSKLTVGARALAKHAHRDETDAWWGVCTGSETAKNEHAKDIICMILENATWINIHELPGKVCILEIRHKDGYGARWSADGSNFRGFLEPQMEEGWNVGWKH